MQYSRIVIEFGVFIVVQCARLAGGTWTVSGLKNMTGEAPSFASPTGDTQASGLISVLLLCREEAKSGRFAASFLGSMSCFTHLFCVPGQPPGVLFSYPRVEIIIMSSA